MAFFWPKLWTASMTAIRRTNPQDAKKFDKISIQEVIDRKLAVVDLTASILCMENHMPMYVFATAGGKQHYQRSRAEILTER